MLIGAMNPISVRMPVIPICRRFLGVMNSGRHLWLRGSNKKPPVTVAGPRRNYTGFPIKLLTAGSLRLRRLYSTYAVDFNNYTQL